VRTIKNSVQKMIRKIAIVVPCFNEAKRFPLQYWREMLGIDPEIQWVFVNDGSTDSTLELLQLLDKESNVKIFESQENFGKGNAIRLGFLECLANFPDLEILGYLDSDGAFSKIDVKNLIDIILNTDFKISDFPIDAVISSRVALSGHQIQRKPSRHYIGRVIATFLTRDWSDAPYDTQSGLKLFRNSNSFKHSIIERFQTKWFVDVELLARIGVANGGALNIWEEPLTSWHDVAGSNLSFMKSPKLIREILLARREIKNLIQKKVMTNGSH